jgi:hypothetical protein
MHGERRRRVRQAVATYEDQVPQVRAFLQFGCQAGSALGRSDQQPNVAVAQYVCDLSWLEERIDWHEHAAGARRAEHCDDRLRLLRQEDGDALELAETERHRGSGELIRLRRQHRILDHSILVGQGNCIRGALGSSQWQLEK